MIAILGLGIAGIPYVTRLGLTAAVTVAVMIVAALTVLPALPGLIGRRIDSLRVPHIGRRRGRERGRHRHRRGPEPAGASVSAAVAADAGAGADAEVGAGDGSAGDGARPPEGHG